MSRKLSAVVVLGTLLTGMYAVNRQCQPRAEDQINDLPVAKAPSYSSESVPDMHCSRYVRFAADDMFGLTYVSGDSWQLRNDPDNVIPIPIKGFEDLVRLQKQGTLIPGDIIGFYSPNSIHANDQGYRDTGYTHVVLYTGNEKSKLYGADKFGKLTRQKFDITDLVKDGWNPVEVVHYNRKRK